jgi:2-dehydro-3-deoxygluconokinase
MTAFDQLPPLDCYTFGETMLRLTPPNNERLETTTSYDIHIGGAESNLAVGLARLGKRTAWMSRLPDSPQGRLITNTLRAHGVDVADVGWADPARARVGTYYLERGAPPRPARVWYDRANSAASRLSPEHLPYGRIAQARWLHLTGITAALSDSCAQAVGAALRYAREHQVKISFDVNYRALLWPAERAARVLDPFCAQADLVFIAARDAAGLFGITDIREVQRRWGGTVCMTNGSEGAQLCDAHGATFSTPAHPVTIIERLGAGDAFAAGVLCALMEDATPDQALRMGCAVAALKLTIPGDFALVTRAEVEALMLTATAAGAGPTLNR